MMGCFLFVFVVVSFRLFLSGAVFLWANIGLKRRGCCLFETALLHVKWKLEKGLDFFF